MQERTLRIVVLDAQPGQRFGVTESIAAALAAEPAPRNARASEPPSMATEGEAEARVHEADAAVALDAASLERARESGVPVCAVVLPSFDIAWPDDLGQADLVLVAHEVLRDALVRRGVALARIDIVGPVAPEGWAPATERNALRAAAGLDPATPVVIVPAAVLDEEGPHALLMQLALVSKDVVWLFDVGNDIETADALRRIAPAHGVRGYMFADGPDAVRHWQLADVVLGRARGDEVLRALAIGSPLVLLPPGRTDSVAAAALEASGAARRADSMATLAVTIDLAVTPDALAAGRAAAAKLDSPGSAMRIATKVRDAWIARHDAGQLLPRGLPTGLEKLPDTPIAATPIPDREGRTTAELEARIDAELDALKKRL